MMPIPRRSTEPARQRHRREVHPTHWLISTQVWSAGLAPIKFVEGSSLEKGKGGRIVVDEYLRAADRVFALGDCAASREDPLPPTDREWNVYKKGVAPAPKVVLHHFDPRKPCPKPNLVFVLGGPGSGKGTMCELAETQLGWIHLSIGELLRAELERGGTKADMIAECLKAGKLAPNDIVVTLLKNAMECATRTTGKNNFLLDGFPRSMKNLEGWFEIFGQESMLPKMLYLECPYDVLEQRILGRANFTGRSDDNLESIKLRFDTFKAETLPAVDYFRSKNKCAEIDTSQDRQTVYSDIVSHLAEYTDTSFADKPLTQKSEMLLGLRPFPRKE